MSDAEDRLIAAWTRLAKDVTAAAFSHLDVHAGAGWKLPERFTVSPDIRCLPAATGTSGEVRVPVPVPAVAAANRSAQGYHASPVRLLEWDPQRPGNQVPATVTPAGSAAVLVSIGAQPVGTYIGAVIDGSGAVVAPFVIYIDGL